jgi:FkbM family methyltransferase
MKAFCKKYIPDNSFLYKLNRIRYRSQKVLYHKLFGFKYPEKVNFQVLDAYVSFRKKLKFVQIGANDGVVNDPLFHYLQQPGWEGILVEPIPCVFEDLKRNHSKSKANLYFENSAINLKSGSSTFYRLRREYGPGVFEWLDQVSSFRKEVTEAHMGTLPDVTEVIDEVKINCITLSGLFEKYAIDSLDLLLIDTEGFDAEILRMIPFRQVRIDLIIFEHIHLIGKDYEQVVKLLRKNGYLVYIQNDFDTVAIQKNILKNIKT